MMRNIDYKDFSLKTHLDNLRSGNINSCHIELTFSCGLKCPYCYCNCFAAPEYRKRELESNSFKRIILKLKKAGVVWLFFTGGDPLNSKNFCEIYRYAKEQGFIVIVLTAGYGLTAAHERLFKEYPPFYIDLTINAVDREDYERITGVCGSFDRMMYAVDFAEKNNIPLRIKTQCTKLNNQSVEKVRVFALGRKIPFNVDYFLTPRLNGDKSSLSWRIERNDEYDGRICTHSRRIVRSTLFNCSALSGDSIYIDPYGNISICPIIRMPAINVVTKPIIPSVRKLIQYFVRQDKQSYSDCQSCRKRDDCSWCPGKAWLENGTLDKPIEYCCVKKLDYVEK